MDDGAEKTDFVDIFEFYEEGERVCLAIIFVDIDGAGKCLHKLLLSWVIETG